MGDNEEHEEPPKKLIEIKQNLVPSTFLKPSDYVGFSKLPYQVYRKSVQNGFQFNLMILGESGLGKSSLINTMFWADVMQKKVEKDEQWSIERTSVNMEEGDVRLKLNILTLDGFGDNIDNSQCWKPVRDYLEEQYAYYLTHETRINRLGLQTPDTRVHALLYFISPVGHGLKPLDLETMKILQESVNIIPVIGKADTLTGAEQKTFKNNVRRQLKEHGIKIFDFKQRKYDEDEEDDDLDDAPPFAVVSSNTLTTLSDGRVVRGREYPWGTVNIENKEHCDFTSLQSLLWAYNTQDLIDATHELHYENYRCKKLLGDTKKQKLISLPDRETEMLGHKKKLEKDEVEMNNVFHKKVETKLQRLKDTEAKIHQNLIDEMKDLEKQREELKELQEKFLKEKKVWKSHLSASAEQLSKISQSQSSINLDIPKNWGFITLKRNKKK